MLKNIVLIISVVFFLAIVPIGVYFLSYTPVSGVEEQKIKYTLPYPGLLPDNPLYFFKNIRDQVLQFVTRDNLKKAEVYLLLSDKKTAMAISLQKKGKENMALKILEEAEQDFTKIKNPITTAQKQGVSADGEFISKIKLSNEKHREVIETFIKEANPSQNDTLRKVLNLNEKISKEIKSL